MMFSTPRLGSASRRRRVSTGHGVLAGGQVVVSYHADAQGQGHVQQALRGLQIRQ